MNWKNVYVFISSTFNDMHAERDYLIKNVFPELSSWCEKYRLRLIDVDLRWGVTEEDATKNNRVIDLCMQGIDRCRPFFICFLGQRRGWVPTKKELSSDTLGKWPDLEGLIGKQSITELEILHSLFVQNNIVKSKDELIKSKHCLFLFRDSSYIDDIFSKKTRNIYDESSSKEKDEFDNFKKQLKASYQELAVDYYATWDPGKTTPELYKKDFTDEVNSEIQNGRLTNFTINNNSMKQFLLNYLKEGITKEYPEHFMSDNNGDLLDELALQNKFLISMLDGYVAANNEGNVLSDFFDDPSKRLLIITSEEGVGKSSFAANIINLRKNSDNVIYRFVSASDRFVSVYDVLRSILIEMAQNKIFDYDSIPVEDHLIKTFFLSVLNEVDIKERHTIVIDGFDCLSKYNGLEWIYYNIPSNFKFVFTLSESIDKDDLLLEEGIITKKLKPLTGNLQKELTEEFLSKYLKKFDAAQLEELMRLDGAANPLFLRIALSELRVFGSFDLLIDKIKTSFGGTPTKAFESLLERLQGDVSDGIKNEIIVPLFFGLISCSMKGLSTNELSYMIHDYALSQYSLVDIREKLNEIYYQIRDFLLIKNDKISFRHMSLETAVSNRYSNLFDDCRKIIYEYSLKIIQNEANSSKAKLYYSYEEVLYQLNMLKNVSELANILGDFKQIYKIIVHCGPEIYLKAVTWLPFELIPNHIILVKNVVIGNYNLIDRNRECCVRLLVDRLFCECDEHICEQITDFLKNNNSVNLIPCQQFESSDKNPKHIFKFDNISNYMYSVEHVIKHNQWWIIVGYDGQFLLVNQENPSEYDFLKLEGLPDDQIIYTLRIYKNYLITSISDESLCFYDLKTTKLEKKFNAISKEFDIYENILLACSDDRIDAFDIESMELLYSAHFPSQSAFNYYCDGNNVYINVSKIEYPLKKHKLVRSNKFDISLGHGYHIVSLQTGKVLSSSVAKQEAIKIPLGKDYTISLQKNEKQAIQAFVSDVSNEIVSRLEYSDERFFEKAVLWNDYIFARVLLGLSELFCVFELKSGKLIDNFEIKGKTFLEDEIVIVYSHTNNYIIAYTYDDFLTAYSKTNQIGKNYIDDFGVTSSLIMKKFFSMDEAMMLIGKTFYEIANTSLLKEMFKSLNLFYAIKKIKSAFSTTKQMTETASISIQRRENDSEFVLKKNIGGENVETTFVNNGIAVFFLNKYQLNKLMYFDDNGTWKTTFLLRNIKKLYKYENTLIAVSERRKFFMVKEGKPTQSIKSLCEINSATGFSDTTIIYSNKGKLLCYADTGELLSVEDVDKDLSPRMVAYGVKVFLATESGKLIMHIIGENEDYVIKNECFISYLCMFNHYLVYVENNMICFFDTVLMRDYASFPVDSYIEKIAFVNNEMFVLNQNGCLNSYMVDFSHIRNRINEFSLLVTEDNFFDQVEYLEQFVQAGDDPNLLNSLCKNLIGYIETHQYFASSVKIIFALSSVLSISVITKEKHDVSQLPLKISDISCEFVKKTNDKDLIKTILELNKRIFAEAFDSLYNIDLTDEESFKKYFVQLKLNIIKMIECAYSKEDLLFSQMKLFDILYEYTRLLCLLDDEEKKRIYKRQAMDLCKKLYDYTQDEDYQIIMKDIEEM